MSSTPISSPSGLDAAPVITLTTDFGLEDPYAGIMKGVIVRICPRARIIDLTHGIPAQDVLAGFLALEASRPFFPSGTVHLAVVDPGVGTDRRAVAVRTGGARFVAPDNGLLSFLGKSEILEIRHLQNPSLWLDPVSDTFHGRDVFAPVAAHLAAGRPFEDVGPAVSDLRRIELPEPKRERGAVRGEVLTFDHFGSAITNLRVADLPPGARKAFVAGAEAPIVRAYASVETGSVLCLVGSSGRLELSVRNGSAREALRLNRGEPIRVIR